MWKQSRTKCGFSMFPYVPSHRKLHEQGLLFNCRIRVTLLP